MTSGSWESVEMIMMKDFWQISLTDEYFAEVL